MTTRDEVALIIDPESIKGRESYAALPGFVSPEAAQKAADYQFGEAIKEAYAKADAILALFPPEPTEAVAKIVEAYIAIGCADKTASVSKLAIEAATKIISLRSMPLQDHAVTQDKRHD